MPVADNVKINPTIEEIRNEVLNFQILERPLYSTCPLTGQQLSSKTKTTYRIIDGLNGQPELLDLGEVGSGYKIVQNDQFLDKMVQPVLETGMAELYSALSLYQGATVAVQMKLTEIEPVPGDVYRCYLMAFNSNDGSGGIGYQCGTERVSCRNTFRTAMNSKASQILSARHTKNVEVSIDLIVAALDLVNGGFIATLEQLQKLASVCIESEDQIRKVVKVAFSQKNLEDATFSAETTGRKPRVLEDIVNLFHNGKGQDNENVAGTGLALFNAITEYTNHVTGTERKKPSSADSRLDSVLFGSSAKIADKASEAILALA